MVAEVARHFVSGQISNFEFEDKLPGYLEGIKPKKHF